YQTSMSCSHPLHYNAPTTTQTYPLPYTTLFRSAWLLHIFERVARVDHDGGVLSNPGIIEAGVVGHDDDRIRRADGLLGERHRLQVDTLAVEVRHVRVVIADVRTALLQQADDVQRGAFTQVVNVALVRRAQNQDVRAVDRLTHLVERIHDLRDDVQRHVAVDL